MRRVNLTIGQSHRANNLMNRMKQRAGLVLAVICLTSGLALPTYCWTQQVSSKSPIAPAANSAWTNTGNLNAARRSHTATLLPNGKVLVAGGDTGFDDPILNSAELYDPANETWSYTGSLNIPRLSHTATLLPDGKVLVAGGWNDLDGPLNSAEIYDPANGTWSSTGNLSTVRSWHTATLLQDDKVLVVGGSDQNLALKSAELYDPATGTWSVTGSIIVAGRSGHTATILKNGKVLIVGGIAFDYELPTNLPNAESYDPGTGAWSVIANLNAGPIFHTATLLPDGKVLLAGGHNWPQIILSFAELYDPATGWYFTGSLSQRLGHTATLLPTGTVLVAGGYDVNRGSSLNSAELYHSALGIWDSTTDLNTPRDGHTATLLTNGKVLVAGGLMIAGGASGSILNSAELYDPAATIAIPRILSATVQGKKLFVFGENFEVGAVILLNGEEQKTLYDDRNPRTTLIGKKAGKRIKPGDKLQVRNFDGTLSEELIFSGS